MSKLAAVLRGVSLLGVVSVLWTGCTPPTSFEGESKFPGGAEGCYRRCSEQRMEMASFVYVGEFATACACRLQTAPVPPPVGAPAAAPRAAADDSASMVAASAGVEMQRRRAEEAARRQSFQPMMVH